MEGAATSDRAGDAVGQASEIAMERYELDQIGAVALLGRLARRHKVKLEVVALAIVAAEITRRMRS
jgi:hypothetical protein